MRLTAAVAGGRALAAILILAFALVTACGTSSTRDDMAGQDDIAAHDELEREAAEQEGLLAEVNQLAHDIEDRVRAARDKGNALTELEALRSIDAETAGASEMARDVLALKLSELSATVGNYADAIAYADRGAPPNEAAVDSALARSLARSRPVPALEAIRDLASGRQVIMINEAHHDPRHRAFTIQLLEVLRDEGFQYFAAETLNVADTALAMRGYPTSMSGAYIVEPVYGSLVRAAIRLGYTVIAYESEHSNTTDEREREQAANLQARILDQDPDAKIVVHAGYGHIYEAPLDAVVPMAVRFRERTGIDPLSIDQTIMTEHARRDLEHPLFRLSTDEGRVEVPTIFMQGGAEPWSVAPDQHDATLFHPRVKMDGGRPNWLALGGRRIARPVPVALVPEGVHALVRAWPADEPEDAIPIDQIEIAPGAPRHVLLLAPGTYRLAAESAEGSPLGGMEVRVP